VRRRPVDVPPTDVPAELAMGPRVDVWANAAALTRLGSAPVNSNSPEGWAVMISARRNHQHAVHAWAEQTGRTGRQARALIPSRRPYWPPGEQFGQTLNQRTACPATGNHHD